ncbi:phage major capsid protein [Mucilaginibacter sp.]|jgi:HK97 family phage major capsid protein|uniref:phage major capsid protein n=1 Tax=Mucilaginibacter sp. TaxID=1882438 RepID=UPI003566758F
MFKYKSAAELAKMSEYELEKYQDEKAKHEAKIAQDAGTEAGKAAGADAAKTEVEPLKTELDELKGEVKVIKDERDQYKVEMEANLAEINRFKAAAKENEKKGRFFDEALNDALSEEKTIKELQQLKTDRNAKVTLTLKDVGTMGISSIADISMANAQLRPGIISIPNRRIHMRNIMNTGRMTTSDFHYLREVGGEGDVDMWAENSGKKPALDLDYIEKTAPSQYIAGVLDISRKSLDDIAALRGTLAPRLLEKFLIKEDQQILSGLGTGSQLEGILQVAEAYDGSKTRLVEKVIDAIGQLEENEFYADGIIMRPRDWAAIAVTVSTQQEFTLPGLGIVTMQNGVLYLNGVPVYKMNGMPLDNRQFLVGDWLMGSQLLIREDPRVEVSYENKDNFEKNIVTFRVEGRDALPIYFDDAYVKGSTGATT